MQYICYANTWDSGRLGPRMLVVLVIVAIHAGLLVALQAQMTAQANAVSAEPLIVDLIAPTAIQIPPQRQPPRRSEKPPQPKLMPPRVAKPRPSPHQPPASAQPAPEIAAAIGHELAPSPAGSAAEAETAAADEPQPVAAAELEPMTTTAPRFDAAYLSNPAPVYPLRSRRAGEAGKVVLRVLVTPDGSAGEVRLRDSSGFEQLDEAAIAAVRRWRFVAARRGETNVAAWVVVPLRFDLDR